ncbi:MAG: sugar transferase [Thermoleophilaceae bacterium]|nr:sugar transferase [Thermoleophilaceae bacterium]
MNRALDLVVAAGALLLSAPILLVAAAAIRLDTPGPVFYRHPRVGRDGVPFELWKLRTMVVGAEHRGAGLYIEDRDPRITRAGWLLRRFSLDELPNLLNVLQGDLAIVGPRPTVQVQVDRYTPHQRRRLEVRPGITGWAQVNGRTELSWPERIELDVWYVDHRSPVLDLRILARTVKLLATGQGLYSQELEQGWGDGER